MGDLDCFRACQKMRVFPLVTAVLLAVIPAVSASLIVMPPLAGKSGPEKLLIVINGAYVKNTNYQEVSEAIQHASSTRLWIAIPSFIASCPNPGEMNSKLADAVATVKQRNFTNMQPARDVYISGHSLGGIMCQSAVANGGYAGLILFGSYLTTLYKYSLKTFKSPVLTLAGELDGLTRITRIAADGPAAVYRFPVFALKGQSHSQFCSNVNVTSFGNKDLRPEVTWDVAHAAIAEAVANFITLTLNPKDSQAQTYIDTKIKYTQRLLQGFLKAQDEEKDVCANAQKVPASNVTSSFTVSTNQVGNFASFDTTYPKVDTSSRSVTVVTEVQHHLNPADSSITDASASEVDCKTLTESSLLKDFGDNGTIANQGCAGPNVDAVSRAESLLTQ